MDFLFIRRVWKTALPIGGGLAICAGANAYAQLVAPPTPNAVCATVGGCSIAAPSGSQPPAAQNPITNAAGNAARNAGASLGSAVVNSILAPAPPPPPLVVPRAPDAGPQGVQLDQLQQRSDADWQRQQEDAHIKQQAAAASAVCSAQSRVNADQNNPVLRTKLGDDERNLSTAKRIWEIDTNGAPPPCSGANNETASIVAAPASTPQNSPQKPITIHYAHNALGLREAEFNGVASITTADGQFFAGEHLVQAPPLGEGDRIDTGKDGSAKLIYDQNEGVELGPNSHFVLTNSKELPVPPAVSPRG